MDKWVYDVEVFPNLFCVTFLNVDTREVKPFVIFDNRNDITELEDFVNQDVLLVGFNNLLYDGAILQFVLQQQDSDYLLEDLFDFSSRLISSDRFGYNPETARYQRPEHVMYKQLDLMKIQAFDLLGVSLKQCSINLRWHRIQDLPYPYNHMVANWQEANKIIEYNLNDVLISERLYLKMLPLIELREQLSVTYGVDLTSASDSKIANLILEHFYRSELNLSDAEMARIKKLRTKRDQLLLGSCIAPNIKYQTNFFRRIHREISSTLVRKQTNFKYAKSIQFGGMTYDLGVGGLHSEDFAASFVSDDQYTIMDADVASYYPSMMIVNNIRPDHLGDEFIKVLRTITAERLKAKKVDKVKADGLKITINSIFGKLGSDTFWLEDPKAMLSVTVSGQLYLLMLIEALVLNGIQVISANTDGIVSRIPNHMMDKYLETCNWWQQETGFALEYTKYVRYVRQDVNNYITVKDDGETKAKGRFVAKIDLKKGYKYPIVPRAMYEYMINGVPLETTIGNHRDILDFCMSQKVGRDFQMELVEGDERKVLQKNNRYFISLSGGELVKRHKVKDTVTGLQVGKRVAILNDYFADTPFEEYQVDFDFYIEEAKKFCDNILPYDNYLEPFEDEPEGLVIDYSSQQQKEELLFKLHGIKGLSDKTVNGLVKIIQEFNGETFIDMLIFADENKLISAKYADLIAVNYFSQYGKNKKLTKFFEEFRTGTNKYSSKLSEKTRAKRLEALRALWHTLPDEAFSFREQIGLDMKVLGRVSTTYPQADKMLVFVEDVSTKYSPKVKARSIKTGKEVVFKIQKGIFTSREFDIGEVLLCRSFEKKAAVAMVDGKFVEREDGSVTWWLRDYSLITDVDKILGLN